MWYFLLVLDQKLELTEREYLYKRLYMQDEMNDDIELEETDESGEVSLKERIKKLKDKLEVLQKEKEEYLLGWQRTKADYANLVKNTDLEKKELIQFANRKLISEIIPVLDNYALAKANKTAWESVDPNWRKGIEYIFSQLEGVLEKQELKTIGVVGEKFDPNLHESLELVHVSDKMQDDTVMEVIQNGYEISGRVIRPAKVKVGTLH